MALSFHWADYVVFVFFLSISLGIGVYYALSGGRQRSTREFILADRRLQVVPTVLSMVMSYLSAIMVIGFTAETYSHGIRLWVWCIPGITLGAFITERVIAPWLFKLQLVSVFEYLERRYKSRSVRSFGACLGILSGVLYSGIAMFAPSIALQSVTGLSIYISIPVMAVLATTYTAMGGMKAVIWTDVFQAIIFFIGLLAIIIKGNIILGGMTEIISIAKAGGRINWDDWSVDPRVRATMWSGTIGFAVEQMYLLGINQASVQRYSAIPSLAKARMTMFGNMLMYSGLVLTVGLLGTVVYSYYDHLQCDPISNGQVTSSNEILALFVSMTFDEYKGFTGLFIACMYSGALSSVSSTISGCGANIWMDVLQWRFSSVSDYCAAQINRAMVIVMGLLSTLVALMSALLEGPLTQMAGAFLGSCGGPLLGIFLLGGTFSQANWVGALCGGLVGFGVNMWVSVGALTVPAFTSPLPPVSTAGCHPNNSGLFQTTTLTTVADNHTLAASPYTTAAANVLSTQASDFESILSPLGILYQVCYLWYGVIGLVLSFSLGGLISAITAAVWPDLVDTKDQVSPDCYISWSTVVSCRLEDVSPAQKDMEFKANEVDKETKEVEDGLTSQTAP